MPRKAQPQQALVPLTELQQKAAALMADGATDERVATELEVPLAWVQSLEGSLPVAAAVTRQQWRRYQAHGQRVRSLLERALDVVEAELKDRPTPELAVALLRAVKVEPPPVELRTAEDMLRAECTAQAKADARAEGARFGISYVSAGETESRAAELFQAQAHRLSAPADPEPAA